MLKLSLAVLADDFLTPKYSTYFLYKLTVGTFDLMEHTDGSPLPVALPPPRRRACFPGLNLTFWERWVNFSAKFVSEF